MPSVLSRPQMLKVAHAKTLHMSLLWHTQLCIGSLLGKLEHDENLQDWIMRSSIDCGVYPAYDAIYIDTIMLSSSKIPTVCTYEVLYE